jgi:4-amino-4-deoxy-L-arabinose transferase-like glycosyltransferase
VNDRGGDAPRCRLSVIVLPSARQAIDEAALAALSAALPGAEILRSNPAAGGLAAAFDAASGEHCVVVGAGAALAPAAVERIDAVLAARADMAVGARRHPESRCTIAPVRFGVVYGRHLAERCFAALLDGMLAAGVGDAFTALVGFRRGVGRRLFAESRSDGLDDHVFLLWRARRLRVRIERVPVAYRLERDTAPAPATMVRSVARALGWSLGATQPARRAEPSPQPAVAGTTPLAAPPARAAMAAVLAAALVILVAARLTGPHGLAAALAWGVALAAVVGLAMAADRARPGTHRPPAWAAGDTVWLGAVLLLTAVLRLVRLADVPPMVHIDSAECGLLGLAVQRGEVADLFAFSPWYDTPYLSFVPYAVSFAALGPSLFSLRLPSALLGVATVVPLYVLARTWFGRWPARWAAILYALSHVAIQFSRIGLWNIQVVFLGLMTCAGLALGLRRRSALAAAVSGLCSGLALYSYTAGRLVPLVTVLFLALQWRQRRVRRFALVYGGALVVAGCPLALNYVRDPSILATDRVASVWVLAEVNRPHVEATLGATTAAGKLWEQVARTARGFVQLGDTSSQYGTLQPLLSPSVALLFAVGVVLVARRWRRIPQRFMALWLGVGLLLGSVAVIDPPAHTRLIAVLPAVLIVAAIALEWLRRAARHRWQLPRTAAAAMVVLVLAHAAVFDLSGYRRFVSEMASVPREWDVLTVVDRHGAGHDYYLFTGPFVLGDSPIFRLLADGARTVSGFTEVDIPERLRRDTAFVLTPDYRHIGLPISERYPGAEQEIIEEDGVVKGFVYRCALENGCRRGSG